MEKLIILVTDLLSQTPAHLGELNVDRLSAELKLIEKDLLVRILTEAAMCMIYRYGAVIIRATEENSKDIAQQAVVSSQERIEVMVVENPGNGCNPPLPRGLWR